MASLDLSFPLSKNLNWKMFSCFSRSNVSAPVDSTQPVDYQMVKDPIINASGIPLRLNSMERKAQRLMRGAILASEYTDKVDTEALAKNPVRRKNVVVKEVIHTLLGVLMATQVEEAIALQKDKDFSGLKKFFPHVCESYRRYKIMNPDLLRTEYVKFLYLLQDTVVPEIQNDIIGYTLAMPVLTVERYLQKIGCEKMLEDPRLPLCITPVPKIKDRSKLNRALRFKDRSVDELVKEWANKAKIEPLKVELAVRSLNDASCFANDNVDSTEELIELLKKFFTTDTPASREDDLSIKEGQEGSRLTHAHAMQYTFVLQSLSLWKNISRKMFRLWIIAEEDMLNPENPYTLRSTGQGFHRVQPAPRLYEAIAATLEETKKELGQWVGSERIHLGDDQVPNAFNFIDKYAQISRIIIPVLRTVEKIETVIAEDKHKLDYIKEVWGSTKAAQKAVLADFFRHAFDGSGGDNMDDAGSCIDGRLTSAWNWCNSIRDKPYYPLFLLTGFNSFDGDLTL